jgi:hypothetical protein
VGGFVEMFQIDSGGVRPEGSQEEFARPAWFGPPEDELGVCVPFAVVLGLSDTATVAGLFTQRRLAFREALRSLSESRSISRIRSRERGTLSDGGDPETAQRRGPLSCAHHRSRARDGKAATTRPGPSPDITAPSARSSTPQRANGR